MTLTQILRLFYAFVDSRGSGNAQTPMSLVSSPNRTNKKESIRQAREHKYSVRDNTIGQIHGIHSVKINYTDGSYKIAPNSRRPFDIAHCKSPPRALV